MATTKAQPKTANTALLKNARITEKAARASQYSIYLFDVAVNATKSEIAKAFETLYKHKPVKVNTLNVVRKSFFKRGKLGFGNSSKKAYVFLPKGTKIDII